MHHHQPVQQGLSQPAFLLLACLVNEPKMAKAWQEAVVQATGQVIEPGAFSRQVARLERRGWIEALTTEQPLRLYQITSLGLLAFERADARHQVGKFRERGDPDVRKGKEIIMRLVLWMLRLYQPGWRERYEAEMIALLEQHQITLWTVLDLLMGALDARLDPHYRSSRQLLPLLRLQASWKWLFSALLACWLSLLLWLVMWDMPIPTSVQCDPGDTGCPMHVAIGMHTPPLAQAINGGMSYLSFFFLLFPFLLVLIAWILVQAMKRIRNLLRLLPVALFIVLLVLYFTQPNSPAWLESLFQNGWFNGLFLAMFLASLALVAESGGAMLISVRSWEKRHNLLLATFVRLLALLVFSGMAVVCIATGVWLVNLWDMLPLLNPSFPDIQVYLVLGFVMMMVTIVTALVALARTTVELRAVSSTPNNTSSPPKRDRSDPKVWMMVLPVGLFVFIGLLMIGFVHVMPTMSHLIPLVAVLGTKMIVHAVKQYRESVAALPKQEPLQPVQQVHEHE